MRKKITIKSYFSQAVEYVKESRNYIYFSILILLISVTLGIIFHSKLGFLSSYLQQIVNLTENLKGIDLIAFIFKNNLETSFLSLFLGIFLGLFTLISIMFNGVIIGYVIEKVSSNAGILPLWKLLPHGIFELPAILISIGLGLRLGMFIFSKNRIKTLKNNLYKSILVLLLIIIPLLIIAAIIEGLLITILK